MPTFRRAIRAVHCVGKGAAYLGDADARGVSVF